ncbi:helix-turn-helix domain-containing protein [Noviherbaspirillum saxi]|uniref:Helix-turn-helix domain-containing protein n=2 Tax=Noviherbaspirillum saxi TaxID=2320863 RepID=A0A3A3FHF0_9BURK|nr:helix-turn-helix domain-containing protein [Noviherbaspirillum saxi]
MARREQQPSPSRRGMPDALAARLLRELGQADPSGTLSAVGFVELYREAIGALEERVARGDGHPPMSHAEVDLLCRCVLSARTMDEAVKLAVQFCAMLHPRAGELALERRQNTVVFRMNSLRRRHSIAACLVDITGLYSYLLLFGWLIGEPLRPTEVFLSHPRREDAGPFLGLFEAPVVMGQKSCGFSFDARLLVRPVIRQARDLPAFLARFPFDVMAGPAGMAPLTQRVNAHLEAALAERVALPSGAVLAELLNLSESSLRRQLQAEGSSLSSLRDDCLRRTAERLLRQTDMTVEEIAGQLGFSNGGAFRRWAGQAPTSLRRAS